ncbi:hypothetical protein DFS33DRAFT_1263474 [Desarmillaria ectypa]|nr:hypothetical protein DFS33DRAFT_1263474 [Desarmillaria ectypa]
MASYIRSLFGGSKRRASFADNSKPHRRSHSIPRSFGQETLPSTSSTKHVARRKRSNSLSYTPSTSKGYSYASLPTHTNRPSRHHERHSRELRIVSCKYDCRTPFANFKFIRPKANFKVLAAPYPIYLPTASPQSNHSRTSSSTSTVPDSLPKTNNASTSHSSPRPVLKKTSHSNPHTGIQRASLLAYSIFRSTSQHSPDHVSFANPNRPEVLHMHPLLASSQRHHAPIWYDVTFTPSFQSVVDRKTRMPIPTHTLSQPATDPAKSDKLVLKSNKLPWPIVVDADGRVVTNLDLLCAVHRTLLTRVTHREWEALGHGTHAQLKAARAYEARCRKLGGGWDGGVRRIDWLGEKTYLIGVEVDKSAGVGNLVFGKP